jgi:hypothetical protein
VNNRPGAIDKEVSRMVNERKGLKLGTSIGDSFMTAKTNYNIDGFQLESRMPRPF